MRDRWNSILLGGEGNTARRNVLWNTVGSAVYALTSMLLGALVTRVLGADAGGIFFFAFSKPSSVTEKSTLVLPMDFIVSCISFTAFVVAVFISFKPFL